MALLRCLNYDAKSLAVVCFVVVAVLVALSTADFLFGHLSQSAIADASHFVLGAVPLGLVPATDDCTTRVLRGVKNRFNVVGVNTSSAGFVSAELFGEIIICLAKALATGHIFVPQNARAVVVAGAHLLCGVLSLGQQTPKNSFQK